ncbi:MAG: hypothetical protein IT204_23140 [Fimbriimonadaceae bacterium]|nr:hypothetical protein [Fimbriimonadaceae bacterium]
MAAVDFALIGGFLGAGKTTTCLAVGRLLAAQQRRVAVITNDQAADLVDTAQAAAAGLPVHEIAGGCFCCRFQEFTRRCDEILDEIRPDVLLAEPVGSCADLSATVLQPLKKFYGSRLRLRPYSVLVDPQRLSSHLWGPLAASPVGYLFRKQLEEADLLVLNKVDTLAAATRAEYLARLAAEWPNTAVQSFSATTGEGFAAWWEQVASSNSCGLRLLEIDYDRYAAAEAALGWLNARIGLRAVGGFDGREFANAWLAALRHAAVRAGAEIGHLKLWLTSPAGSLRGSVTAAAGAVQLSGDPLPAITAAEAILNARVCLDPESLTDTVARSVRRLGNERQVTVEVRRVQAFRPGYPEPEARFDVVFPGGL